ncbi:MAG: GH3 auxin-responsive promoter family protein, partial [Phycisphaerae bacterium]
MPAAVGIVALKAPGGRPVRRLFDRLLLPIAYWQARARYGRFIGAAGSATRVQQRVLLEKIRLNADSDFGREHRFDRIGSYRQFTANVPICRYEHIEPYIERLKRGQTRALLGGGQKLLMFALTSGTTARPKFIPVTEQFLDEYRRGWTVFGFKMFSDHPEAMLRPIVQVTSPMDEFRTEGGIACGAITGLMAATQRRLVRRYYATPLCVAQIKQPLAKYYTVMRLAVPQDVALMVTANPATHLRLARLADEHRELLIRDIYDGTLSRQMPVPAAVRQQLAGRLRARPDVARRLERIVQDHGSLLPKHYWRLSLLANWTGGTMGLYLRQFDRYFGPVPVRDIGLLASEARMSIPIADGTAAGILEVTSHFFEFIPADQIDSPRPTVLRCGDLQIGGEYFVLLTTSSGLYRYDIGDLVRVVDYLGQAPIIEFLSKGAHISSLSGEKLTEQQVVQAMQQVCGELRIRVENFALCPRWADTP